ncbi:MAG: Hsp20/alpha crystallin family protein [Lachnospiraceae bacterium]|nr:Hsp20/alpha crystallin family protein [Lachnospiraceae bacterium]
MYLPDFFGQGFLGDWMDDYDGRNTNRSYRTNARAIRADVVERADEYEIRAELPGFKKDELKLELKEGYLTISASKEAGEAETEEKVIRQERYTGDMARTFFVGKDVTHEDIHARFESGILYVTIPKEVKREPVTANISID